MADLRNVIRQLAQQDGETVPLVCTVDAVDKKARTIDCTPLNEGAPLLGVNLQANQESNFGVCLFPAVGSFVVVGFVADGSAGVVLITDKVDSAEIVIGNYSAVIDRDGCRFDADSISAHITTDGIVFNGGNLGGLIVIQKLTEKLNELKETVNALISNYNGHIHATTATVGTGPAVGVLSPTTSTATPAKPFNMSDYENTKVKH